VSFFGVPQAARDRKGLISADFTMRQVSLSQGSVALGLPRESADARARQGRPILRTGQADRRGLQPGLQVLLLPLLAITVEP
jgi:hypothetical protein